VATFDLSCPGKLIGKEFVETSNVTEVRARFLDSVGGYWLAKGQNFGASDDNASETGNFDVSQNERTKSLCRAKIAYLRATDLAKAEVNPGTPPNILDISSEVANDDASAFPYKVENSLHRTNLAINALSAGEVDAACKNE
jgi:hypothetical protein